MKILAIETSCDETAIAIAEFSGPKKRPQIKVLSNIISSQVKLHAKYGGVVPNLAKREHQKNLVPLLLQALGEAGLLRSKTKSQKSLQTTNYPPAIGFASGEWRAGKLQTVLEREPELLKQFRKNILPLPPPQIDTIAVTYGPGLAPALWVGVNFAKALAYLWKKPLIPVNHMAGHLYSALLQEQRISKSKFLISKQAQNSKPKTQKSLEFRVSNLKFPTIALLVSGGHTELVLVNKSSRKSASSQRESALTYKIVGETLDDAAGEAFDKVARILGLGYPGGPAISALAEMELPVTSYQLPKLPRPMINSKDYNFSFSGLKTAVLYLTRDLGKIKTKKLRPAIATEFQTAVVEVLVKKTIRAATEYKAKTILLGGGVAANELLRKKLADAIDSQLPTTNYQLPTLELTGDNALMIALAAYFTEKKKAPDKVGADANVKLGS